MQPIGSSNGILKSVICSQTLFIHNSVSLNVSLDKHALHRFVSLKVGNAIQTPVPSITVVHVHVFVQASASHLGLATLALGLMGRRDQNRKKRDQKQVPDRPGPQDGLIFACCLVTDRRSASLLPAACLVTATATASCFACPPGSFQTPRLVQRSAAQRSAVQFWGSFIGASTVPYPTC